jgi:hypothetical protein
MLLDAIRRAQLNEELNNREQALQRLRELAATIDQSILPEPR